MSATSVILFLFLGAAQAHVGSYILDAFDVPSSFKIAQNNGTTTTTATTNISIGNSTTCACNKLEKLYPDDVFEAVSIAYHSQVTDYYDLREDLSPGCVFVPVDTEAVSKGIVVLTECQAEFAVRGAGHMPVSGAANIDSGVLVALSAFSNITVADDNSTAEVGPANSWYDVNAALAPYGRVPVGGRLKTIGVSGLTLGGGISYFSNKYGFAMDNVVEYEVVIANGSVLTANADQNTDLFWGLKGSSGNLGIVTKYTLSIYDVPEVTVSIQTFVEAQVEAYIEAACELALIEDSDPTPAGGVISITVQADEELVLPFMFGVEAGNTSPPATFANFTAIPGIKINQVTTLADWSSLLDTPYQIQRAFYGAHTVAPDAALVYELYQMFRDSVIENLQGVTGMIPTLTMQPIPKSASGVAASNGIGNVWGLDDSVGYIFWIISSEWTLESDNDKVISWSSSLVESMHEAAQAKGLAYDFVYLNDASDYQEDALTHTDADNLEKLRAVQAKYDPDLVFQKLVPGGFKLPA